MNKKAHILLIFTFAAFMAMADEVSTESIYQASGEVNFFGTVTPGGANDSGANNAPVVSAPTDSSQSAPRACEIKEQTFLPLSFLQKFTQKKPFLVRVKSPTSSRSGEITVDMGNMVSNCNSMISFAWGIGEGQDHTFGTKIQKPAGDCKEINGKLKCKYEIDFAKDGIKTSSEEHWFEPNFSGFKQCLAKTGIFKNGGLDPSAAALAPVKATKRGFQSSGDVLYYCKGPECNRDQNGRRTVPSKVEGAVCQHFQDIIPGGKTFLSRQDLKNKRIKKKFEIACASGDYKLIESFLPEFSEFASMKAILLQVRNKLIAEEIKNLKNQLKESDSYEDFDANEYLALIKDYYLKVVVPKRKEIEELVKLVATAKDENVKKERQKILNQKVKELIELIRDPYLSMSDFNKMVDFAKKAPLHKEKWRKAAEYLFKGISTADQFGRFSTIIGPRIKKKENEAGREYRLGLSLKEARRAIERNVGEKVRFLDKLGVLANDNTGDVSYAQSEVFKAQEIQISHQRRVSELQQLLSEERQSVNECYNPTIGKFGLWTQACIKRSQERQMQISNDLSYYSNPQYHQHFIQPRMQNHMREASLWAQIEKNKHQAYGTTPQAGLSGHAMDPRAFEDPNFSGQFGRTYEEGRRYQEMALMQQLMRQRNYGFGNSSFQNRFPANGMQQMGMPPVNPSGMMLDPRYQQNNLPPWSMGR